MQQVEMHINVKKRLKNRLYYDIIKQVLLFSLSLKAKTNIYKEW